jgi:hypothetical protein
MRDGEKRLTVDLPEPLYRRLKLHALLSDKRMADIVRDMLDRELPAKEAKAS